MFGDHTGKGPKNFRRPDHRVHEDVCEALTAHPEVDATGVEVNVNEGVVHLSGEVDSRRTKRLAELCADGCSGVRDVRNELRIRGMGLNPVAKGDGASAGAERTGQGTDATPRSDYLQ